MSKADHPMARTYLGGISFLESSVSPFPPDPLLVPMVLKEPQKAYSHAYLTTWTSVVGAFLGYGIGYAFFSTWGSYILTLYGLHEKFGYVEHLFQTWGFWAIILKALTPIPFKLVTIAAGVFRFDFFQFVLACSVSRGARFFIEAYMLKRYGEKIHHALNNHLTIISISFTLLLIGGVFLVKYVC